MRCGVVRPGGPAGAHLGPALGHAQGRVAARQGTQRFLAAVLTDLAEQPVHLGFEGLSTETHGVLGGSKSMGMSVGWGGTYEYKYR